MQSALPPVGSARSADDPLLSPGAFFGWCMRNVDPAVIPFAEWYPKYAGGRAPGAYLWETYDRRFTDIVEIVRPGMRVLEIGCGPAIELHWIALQGASCVGIDVNSPRIAAASRLTEIAHAAFARTLDVTVRRTNLLALDAAETFDLVYMKETLHHLEPRGPIFEKIAALLKPGGAIVVLEPNAWNPFLQVELFRRRGFKTIVESIDEETGERYLYGDERVMTPRTIRRLFRAVGIAGETRIFRLVPTVLSAVGPLTALARAMERHRLDALFPPACIHCVFRGRKIA